MAMAKRNVIQSQYDALETRGRRRQPTKKTSSEDVILPQRKREQLTSNTRDLRRNFEMVAWAIRRHLDYVASFRWQATTDDQDLNKELEAWMKRATKPAMFDAAGRHGLDRFIRIMEAERTVNGDVFCLKQNDGTIMAIEGDRVGTPTGGGARLKGIDLTEFHNGIKTDRRGKLSRVMVCERDSGSLTNPRVLPADFFWHLFYIDRFDQYRGVSPLACALNRFRDTYEGMEYALARAKVEQLFALILTRSGDVSMGDISGGVDGDGNEDRSSYEIDFGQGPQMLDMDPGDDAKFLSSDNPGKNFKDYQQFASMVALKALDIPYSFFDESFTNFYGSRGSLMQYLKSVDAKRADLAEFLYSWTGWRMSVAIRDGELRVGNRRIPELVGEWRPVGVPWWDPSKEIDGHLKSIAAGLDNPQRIAKEATGTDYFENLELRKQAEDYAEQLGVEVSFTASNQQAMRAGDTEGEGDTEETPTEDNADE